MKRIIERELRTAEPLKYLAQRDYNIREGGHEASRFSGIDGISLIILLGLLSTD